MTSKFDQLRSNAAALNKASDDLRKTTDKLNGFLKELNLGISVLVEFRPGLKVGYAKSNGCWGLVVDSADMRWPFSEAPREYVLGAAGFLGRVVEALEDESGKLVTQVQIGTKAVEGLIYRIESSGEKGKEDET